MRSLETVLLSVLVMLVAIGALFLVGDIVRAAIVSLLHGLAAVPG